MKIVLACLASALVLAGCGTQAPPEPVPSPTPSCVLAQGPYLPGKRPCVTGHSIVTPERKIGGKGHMADPANVCACILP